MYTSINFSRYHDDHPAETIASLMEGRVWDLDNEEEEIDLATFWLYHIDVNKAFEFTHEMTDILEFTDSSIEEIEPYLESGITGNFMYLERIVVKPECRRQGILSRVVKDIGHLWSEIPILLCAMPLEDLKDTLSTEELKRWYETLGFKRMKYLPDDCDLMIRDAVDTYMGGD